MAKIAEVQEVSLDKLIPYENNPRNNENAVDKVAKSIQEFGFKVPILVDSDFVIIAGHTRLKAAQQLGLGTVPVIVCSDLTEEQAKALRLADNKVAELSTWDFGLLKEELDKIQDSDFDIDMGSFGFSEIKFSDSKKEETKQPHALICPRCGYIQGGGE